MDKTTPSPSRQIRSFLLLIALAVGCAAALATAMLYHYNPSNTYRAGSLLLDPAILTQLPTGTHMAVEYSYWQAPPGKWQHVELPLEKYQQFYKALEADTSYTAPSLEMEALYTSDNISSLKITTNSGGKKPVSMSQELQIPKGGNSYRIAVPTAQIMSGWVYFDHPLVGNLARKILID